VRDHHSAGPGGSRSRATLISNSHDTIVAETSKIKAPIGTKLR